MGNEQITVKDIRKARIRLLEAMLRGSADQAGMYARELARICEQYLSQGVGRMIPAY